MTGTKPARNRRAAVQLLVELKQWLREISDLNAAGAPEPGLPEGGAGARGR
jgi:hypothetical protein